MAKTASDFEALASFSWCPATAGVTANDWISQWMLMKPELTSLTVYRRAYDLFRLYGLAGCRNLIQLYGSKKHIFMEKRLRALPLFASIKLTEACNSKCITCNIESVPKANELNDLEVLDLLRQLRANSIRSVRFTGGEPLLKKNLGLYIEQAKRLGFKRIHLATNGLLLEQRTDAVKEATHVTVSLDGMQATNDYIRGVEGDFDRSIRGIQRLKTLNPRVHIEIATTLLDANLKEIGQLLTTCRSLGLKWFANLFDTHLYFFQGIDTTGLKPSDEDGIKEALALIRRQLAAHPELFSFDSSVVQHMEDYLLSNRMPRNCILGYTNIDVGANGDVYSGCWALEPVGNIRKDRLHTLLRSASYEKRLIRMYNRKCPQCTCGWMVNAIYERL